MTVRDLETASVPRESVPCNLCGSRSAHRLYQSRDYRYEVDDESFEVVRCGCCGLAYVDPRPTEAAIGRYYPASYFAARDDIRERGRYVAQAEYLRELVPGRLLDVGSGTGGFLSLMRERGWDVVAVEPYGATGNIPTVPSLMDERLVPGGFDAITAWSVLEHLHDPRRAFARMRELLKPTGRLIIHVPNLRSIKSRLSYQEDVPRHLYVFDEHTLAQYAAQTALTLRRIEHDTRLMDGSGRGFLKLRVLELTGWTKADFFRWQRLPRPARWRTSPLRALAVQPAGVFEALLCSARLRRTFRVNGYIVAVFERPRGGDA